MQSTPPLSNQRRRHSGIRGLLFTALILGVIFGVWSNRQHIADSISFWQYQPSAAVQQISNKANLSDAGTFAFYASQPVITTGDDFNKECNKQEQHTAILGCYVNNRIYLYDVTDTRLDGIKEVTAAHEMLHAIYQRLSAAEKDSVNKLLEAEYEKLKNDPAYTERMAYYERAEPGQRDNELHSIVGTEIASLDPALEAHYKKYFNDRSKVVSLYKAYNKAFTELEDKRKQLSAQLDALNTRIETMANDYDSSIRQLSADIALFNKKADTTGAFTSQAQFNSERQSLVNRSNALSAQRDQINTLIRQFNTLKDEYNETVTQSNDLYKSIDSSLSPAPKV